MFVRWKCRERVSVARPTRRMRHKTPGPTGKFLLTASLVRSERVGGKPRQKVVAYLGSIAPDRAECPWGRLHFWAAATRRLDALGLGRDERAKVEAALLARVAGLTADDLLALRRDEVVGEFVFAHAFPGGDVPAGLPPP